MGREGIGVPEGPVVAAAVVVVVVAGGYKPAVHHIYDDLVVVVMVFVGVEGAYSCYPSSLGIMAADNGVVMVIA